MTREERLKHIAQELYEANADEKAAKARREGLKSEFFRLYDAGLVGRDHILPVRTIEVPESFFKATSMTKEEFASSRYPGWTVEFCEKNIETGVTTFIFKKDPTYMPGVVAANDTLQVSKEVIEYSPSIDWETLEAECPDIHDYLVKEVIVKEVDEERFTKLVSEKPETLGTLERHVRVKPPALKATSKVIKDDGRKGSN